jgi:hypothetical protein
MVFGLFPNLIMPLKCSFLGKRLCERICFHREFLEFQSYSKLENHFNVGLKQTCSEEIQVFLWTSVYKC